MKQPITLPATKDSLIKVPLAVFELVYRLMLKRIAAGFTREELDFFLGFKSPYWERIENLSRYGYLTIADILILCDLFHCSPRDFTLPARTKKSQSDVMQAYLTERRESGKIVYEAHSQQSGHEGEVLYKITEDDQGSYDAALGREEEAEAYKIITHLFETGYFDEPKDALQIFRKCLDQSQMQLRPRFIQTALTEYLSAKGTPKLVHPTERGKYDYLALAYQKIHQEKK